VSRPSWDDYFMELAAVVAKRSTCNRRAVGCILVKDKRVLTTGYNGSPPGMAHCSEVGCLMVDGHCVRTIHAEQNAIVQAAVYGVSTLGSTCYVTTTPCVHCAKLLISAGIKRIVYRDEYWEALGRSMLQEAGVELEQILEGGVR